MGIAGVMLEPWKRIMPNCFRREMNRVAACIAVCIPQLSACAAIRFDKMDPLERLQTAFSTFENRLS